MNESIKINLPKLGESIVSATVVQWFKKVGDRVALDEPLLEVSTDKVNSEIPSPAAGVSKKSSPSRTRNSKSVSRSPCFHPPLQSPQQQPLLLLPHPVLLARPTGRSPHTCRIAPAEREGDPVSHEIDRIPRTGEGGRLTKKDIEAFTPRTCPLQTGGSLERVKMTPLRKAIADNMVRSFYEAPHASLITEVDVTPLVKLIKEQKEAFQQKQGAKLSITSFTARAIARALVAYPLINSSLDGDTIVLKRFLHLGVAVSVDQGVMVPVIRNCHLLSIADLAQNRRTRRQSAQSHTRSRRCQRGNNDDDQFRHDRHDDRHSDHSVP